MKTSILAISLITTPIGRRETISLNIARESAWQRFQNPFFCCFYAPKALASGQNCQQSVTLLEATPTVQVLKPLLVFSALVIVFRCRQVDHFLRDLDNIGRAHRIGIVVIAVSRGSQPRFHDFHLGHR